MSTDNDYIMQPAKIISFWSHVGKNGFVFYYDCLYLNWLTKNITNWTKTDIILHFSCVVAHLIRKIAINSYDSIPFPSLCVPLSFPPPQFLIFLRQIECCKSTSYNWYIQVVKTMAFLLHIVKNWDCRFPDRFDMELWTRVFLKSF